MRRKKETIFLVLFAFSVLIAVPSAVCEAGSTIYVDASVSVSGDGSSGTPYKTITEGLEEADDGDTVEVKEGTYTENITIPKEVELEGEDKDKVIIVASDHNEPVVKMKDDTEIREVTIKEGENGIYVKKESGVTIEDCIIRENEKYGVKIKRSALVDDWKVTIKNCTIEENDKTGIRGQKRIIDILENEIINNEKDGIYLEGEVIAEVSDNKIKYNDRSGMDVMLDGSDLTIDDNSIKGNDKPGIEVHAIVGDGSIEITNCSFKKNGTYAVRRVQHGGIDENVWGGLLLGSGNTYKKDKKISEIKLKK